MTQKDREKLEEQRKCSRIPCTLDAICETMEGTPPALVCYPATGVNLSVSGMNLVMSRQFSTRTMLFLKLADPTKIFWCGRSAHVIYAKALPPRWVIGCQFTAALTEGELGILLGRQPAPERRMNPRFVPSLETLDHLAIKIKNHDPPVAIKDISVSGMSLVVNQSFADGSQLHVEVTNTANKTSCVLSLRLNHVRKTGDKWIVGGRFGEKIPNHNLMILLS